MVLGLGMRTVWISLRAMNYTDRAFRAAIMNLDKLEEKERDHVKQLLAQKEIARLNVQVGILYAATLAMMTTKVLGMLAATEAGKFHLSELTQVMNETKEAIADTLFTALKPLIDAFTGFLKLVRDVAPLRVAIIVIGALAAGLFALYAISKVVKGLQEGRAVAQAILTFLAKKQAESNIQLTLSNYQLATSAKQLAFSWKMVAISAGAAFGIFFLLKDIIGPLPAALIGVAVAIGILAAQLWLAAGAMSVLTWGLAAIAGGAALAGVIAMVAGVTGFAMGTRSAPYTGLAMVHKGEVVYNPQTDRPTGVVEKRDVGPTTTIQDIDVTIEEVYTKAEIDDLGEEIGKALWKKMKESR